MSIETHDIKKYALQEIVNPRVWRNMRDDLVAHWTRKVVDRISEADLWPIGPPTVEVASTIFNFGGEPLKQGWWRRTFGLKQRYAERRLGEKDGEHPDIPDLIGYKVRLQQHAVDLPPELHPEWPLPSPTILIDRGSAVKV